MQITSDDMPFAFFARAWS